MNFQGKVALITGGSSGMGRAAAIAFGQAGAKAIAAARLEAEGNETVELITHAGGTARFVQADVSKSDGIVELMDRTIATYGRLDCAFNNAGTEGKFAPIAELTEERQKKWQKLFYGCALMQRPTSQGKPLWLMRVTRFPDIVELEFMLKRGEQSCAISFWGIQG